MSGAARRRGWGSAALAVSTGLALLAVLVPVVGHTANAPPPLQVDLDVFDAMKKTTQLPDGVTLAYIDTGNPTDLPWC